MTAVLSTYRVQLQAGMPIPAVAELVPYLQLLGVSHLYASPMLQARPGSNHGYDVTDPTRLNAELGTEADFEALTARLRDAGMGMVLDIVPNHMAAARENRRWEDVLRHGAASPFAGWFDIDWRASERDLRHRVLLPVLGDQRARVLERDEIALALEGGEVRVRYFEHSYPVDPATLGPFLSRAVADATTRLGTDRPEVRELSGIVPLLRGIPPRTANAARLARRREMALAVAQGLVQASQAGPELREVLETTARSFGAGTEGRRRLRRLLDAQAYRLVHWRRAARELNYRRFFDVNDLVALHMESPEVFAQSHSLVLTWVGAGRLDGLRIDHPDGLLDPRGYVRRLDEAVRRTGRDDVPIWLEKILSHGERLPEDWPVAGTVGYDFLNELEAVFVPPDGYAAVLADYRRLTRVRLDFAALARAAKREVLEGALSAGVRRLAERLLRLRPAGGAPLTRQALFVAIVETMVALPVYRTYVDAERPVPEGEDRRLLELALGVARERGRAAPAALALLEAALLASEGALREPAVESQRLRFVERFQQLSGPATAKGIEDTAFYQYVPLLSRCEVGGEPDAPLDDALGDFHAANAHRAARWPCALLAATTHDTKRSADVRARLDVLAELPEAWEAGLYQWRRWNRALKSRVGDRDAPDANTEYLFYQTLLGIWPFEYAGEASAGVPDRQCLDGLRERLQGYMRKAVREAKVYTSWTDPDEAFEAALAAFVDATLDPDRSAAFLADVARLAATIAPEGLRNALARVTLQGAAPGVPDLYQGDELWNFVLVDPDNRRPVDYARRRAVLADVARFDGANPERRRAMLREWVEEPADGRVKLHVLRRVLEARRRAPASFVGAGYAPLAAAGPRARSVVAFGRTAPGAAVVAIAPRWLAGVPGAERLLPEPTLWDGTVLPLPAELAGRHWRCTLTDEPRTISPDGFALGALLRHLPVALLVEVPA